MKQNGQLVASLKYIGNNSFEGGEGYPKAIFELQKDGMVSCGGYRNTNNENVPRNQISEVQLKE